MTLDFRLLGHLDTVDLEMQLKRFEEVSSRGWITPTSMLDFILPQRSKIERKKIEKRQKASPQSVLLEMSLQKTVGEDKPGPWGKLSGQVNNDYICAEWADGPRARDISCSRNWGLLLTRHYTIL